MKTVQVARFLDTPDAKLPLRVSPCWKSAIRRPTPKVVSGLKTETISKSLEELARVVARVQGQLAGKDKDSETIDEACLVGPVEKTRLLHISQGLNPMWALGPRTLAERNVTLRRSSAIPKRSRKLNGMRNANSLHDLG